MPKKLAKWEQFEQLANPNDQGVSRWVTFEEWEKIGLSTNNGCQWCQKDRGVGEKYSFEKQYDVINGHRRVSAIRLTGLKVKKTDAEFRDHSIPVSIRKRIIAQHSAILHIHSQNECDHKDGRYSNKNLTLNDFQCLSKAENDAKRQHCKNCRSTGCRFRASVLGYSVDYIAGDEHSNNCIGCYWYDPIQFNKIISQNFKVAI